ncbi:MAG: OB-fold nucleic acid binding domain-containing protein [Candidatus Thorarchaeota archaeon]
MLTLEETIELILKHHKSEYEKNDILVMIQEKRNELGPEVINDESAAMIVARELGVDLLTMSPSARQRIEDINESTKNVTGLVGRVDRIGEVRTFTRKDDNSEGRVVSIFVSDETGSIRVALWDDKTKAVTEEYISVGSIVQIRGAYVKIGLRDTPELNLGRVGTIKPLESDEIEELGVAFEDKAQGEAMKISTLQEGTYDVSVKVEIQRVFNVSTFTKKDGVEGKVLAMVVADDTGSTRLVFWDDKADEVEGIAPGEVIGVSHAYTRPNRDGDGIEIHVGKSSVIERGLKDKIETAETASPFAGSSEPLGMKDIADLSVEMKDVDIQGKIATIYEIRTFTRKDGDEGQVQNIVIADKSSQVRVTFWGDDTEKIAKAKEGDVIRILHGYVKEGYKGGVEFQVGNRAEVKLNPKGTATLKKLDLSKITDNASSSGAGGGSSEPLGKTPIEDLSVDMRDVDIEGKVVTAYDVKTFTRKDDGSEGRLRNVIIADKTSKIRVTFWGEDVDKVEGIQEGDVIEIRHGYVKEGFRGGLEYQVGRNGEIVLNPEGSEHLKQLDLSDITFETGLTQAPRILIGEIDDSYEGKNVEVCGIIVDVGQNRVYYEACPDCNKKLEIVDNGYNCKSCGKVTKAKPRMFFKITIDDGSGSIKSTLFDTIGEELLGMTAVEAKKLVEKSGKEDEPLRASTEEIRGRYIAIHGRVKRFQEALEISSNGVKDALPEQEIKRLKEVIQKETK